MVSLLEILRCPRTGQMLRADNGRLVTEDGALSYAIEDGIPVLLPTEAREVKP